jgi:hypothetical protein
LSEEIDRALGLTAATRSAYGDWATGGEPSVAVEYGADASYEDIQYAMSWKGLAHDQMAVVAFKARKGGKARLFLSPPVDVGIDTIRAGLDKAGVEFRTIIPGPDGDARVTIAIYGDSDIPKLEERVANFQAGTNIEFKRYEGDGQTIGSWTSREEGRNRYLEIIDAHERGDNNRGRISGGLRERLRSRVHVWNVARSATDDVANERFSGSPGAPNREELSHRNWFRRWVASVVAPLRGFDSPAPIRELPNEEGPSRRISLPGVPGAGNSAELLRAAMAEDAGPVAKAIAEAMWTEDEALMRAKLRLLLARWPELTAATPEAGRVVWMTILAQAVADGFGAAEEGLTMEEQKA